GRCGIVQAVTDNRNRTVAELRKILERHGGALGTSAAWAFERKGVVLVPKHAADEDRLLELTMDVGAEEVSLQVEAWQGLCEVTDLDGVTGAIEKAQIKVESSSIGYVPKVKKPMSGKDAER